ncbi:hypothetical protein V8F20_003476 [Naviculisporaceae sp. PSN 640]
MVEYPLFVQRVQSIVLGLVLAFTFGLGFSLLDIDKVAYLTDQGVHFSTRFLFAALAAASLVLRPALIVKPDVIVSQIFDGSGNFTRFYSSK